jgi:hypothetical protein
MAKIKRLRPSGFPCPLCDSTRTSVERTETVDGKFQRRRRRCPNGHEFETTEAVCPEERSNAPTAALVRELADSVISALKSDPLSRIRPRN